MQMNLKQDSVLEQEIVLIHIEEQPAFYARVEKITADVKPQWWRVKFLMLTIPLNVATWILDDEQIRGADFTMGGTPIRIEKVEVPEEIESPEDKDGTAKSEGTATKQARVLSINTKKKS
jgi:hypothetical protein